MNNNKDDKILRFWLINHGPEIIYQLKALYSSQDTEETIFRILDSSLSFSSKIIPYLLVKYGDNFFNLIKNYIDSHRKLEAKHPLSTAEEKQLAVDICNDFIAKYNIV